MLKIYKQQKAEQDLIDIWLYTFKNWGVNQADTYLDQLNIAFRTTAEHPDVGVNIDAIRRNYKKYQIKQHIIFYTVEKAKIQIVRVLGNDMDYLHHLK